MKHFLFVFFPGLLVEKLRHTCLICFLSPFTIRVAQAYMFYLFFSSFTIRVAQAYVNQKKLDTETKILQANASQFCRQTTQWLKLVEDFNTALKVANRLCCMGIIMLHSCCLDCTQGHIMGGEPYLILA